MSSPPNSRRRAAIKVVAAIAIASLFLFYANRQSYEPLTPEEQALVGEWFLTHDLGHREDLALTLILPPDLFTTGAEHENAGFPSTPALILRSNRTVTDVSSGQINRKVGTWYVANDRLTMELRWPTTNVHRSLRDNLLSMKNVIVAKYKGGPNRNPAEFVFCEIIRSNQIVAIRKLSPFNSFDHGPTIDAVLTRSPADADRLDRSDFAATYAELDSPLQRLPARSGVR